MQIYSLFDAPMRAFSHGRAASADLLIGFHSRLLPPCAGPDTTCDYVFLQAGQTQQVFVAGRGEWWACLRGGIRIAAPGHEPVLIGSADMFAPTPDLPMQVHVVLDSILIRVAPDDSPSSADARPSEDTLLQGEVLRYSLGCVAALGNEAGPMLEIADGESPAAASRHAGFAQLQAGECLLASGLRWALCHRGALCLRWRQGGENYLNFVQPGTLFVPDSHESYSVEVLLPATGLLYCSDATETEAMDAFSAVCRLPVGRGGVVEMPRAPYGTQAECLPA
ncbi:hypothetical protein LMG23992_00507 [Cupriavidus laharis]|uniref:AraC family transcriptional regulator n=1 Tax=Cupriavidus laharis TaxID=151654 RepID=A0ABM8WDX4_9BURK|nr:hypothetical protein [Cupriavidus laharis]CAG9165497.1 hypothetical protein LMG23992_00507 [Cupriavidus laharis]